MNDGARYGQFDRLSGTMAIELVALSIDAFAE
jgi:hypothetical protein